MNREILPIGSVVLLKGASKKLVIMGILQMKENDKNKRLFDYMGVLYPEGYLGKGSHFLFNHEDINDVIFRGYSNPERDGMIELILQLENLKMEVNTREEA